jgi:hypothetical protein
VQETAGETETGVVLRNAGFLSMIWPQLIMALFVILALSREGMRHGEQKKPDKYNFWASLVALSIVEGIYWWGGFWEPLIDRLFR